MSRQESLAYKAWKKIYNFSNGCKVPCTSTMISSKTYSSEVLPKLQYDAQVMK